MGRGTQMNLYMKASFLVLLSALLLVGCQSKKEDLPETTLREFPAQTEYVSTAESEECYVCGQRSDSLMPYYAKRDSVGIIHWNNLSVSDTEVRAYDDNGKELFGQGNTSMKMTCFGDGYGSVYISGMPARGISNVDVHFSEKDEVDLEKLEKELCQNCLDKVVCFYTDQMKYGEENRNGTTGYCLIDFQTKELYTLSDPYRGYSIRDYYITFDIQEENENCIDLLLFYAPERKK